jgi:hypothetical protein
MLFGKFNFGFNPSNIITTSDITEVELNQSSKKNGGTVGRIK